jgi:D-arginine dehydrogenase
VSGDNHEVIIIGAGVAGISFSYFLTERGVKDILILERESQPAYHASGRSAAVLVELDTIPALHRLKVRSAGFFRDPPRGFSENPLLDRMGALLLLGGEMWKTVTEIASSLAEMGTTLELLTPAQAVARVPVLSEEHFDGAVLLPEDGQMDVHELLQSYTRHARAKGAIQRLSTEVKAIRVEDGRCTGVETGAGAFKAPWVVNAAGAWAGAIGRLAGAEPISFVPHRRTIVTFPVPEGVDVKGWPLVQSEVHKFYFRPESGGLLLLCPMDEDPMEPCDVRPDDLVVAEGIERLKRIVPRLEPRTIRRSWSGLRTFSADRVPVVGEDPRLPGFFWLAGQGGCGIETSPIMGQVAADLLVSGKTDKFDEELLSPSRLALKGCGRFIAGG